MFDLIVKSPFRSHAVGDRITNPDLVTRTLAGPNQHRVVKIAASDLPGWEAYAAEQAKEAQDPQDAPKAPKAAKPPAEPPPQEA